RKLGFIGILVIIICVSTSINRRKCYQFGLIYNNWNHIAAEFKKTRTTSADQLNNITSSYRLLINPRQIHCQSSLCQTVDIIYLVKSALRNVGQRKAIRETWGTHGGKRMITIFIVGYSEPLQSQIEMESITHGDILQFDMEDIYDNLVFKTVFSIAWLCDSKIKTKYVHFVDDDRLINSKNLLKVAFNNLQVSEIKMIGFRVHCGKPYRSKSSKWYISVTEYEFDFWPPYLLGGTILTNLQVIKKLREGIPFSKVIRIEDAYIGILAKLLNISLEHNENFSPAFISGYELINKISSPDYRSYNTIIKEWKLLNSFNNDNSL
ncbi:Hypothetical predicted protein, partial [Mytilus galloprovincialis]